MSNEIIIARPDTAVLQTDVETAIAVAEAVQVTTAPEHGSALEMIRDLRDREKAITEHFEPSRKALDAAKKEVLAARDSLVKPLEAARGVLGGKAVEYSQEQERIRAEAQRKADEEARIAREKADAEAKAAEDKRLAALEEAIKEEDEKKAEEIMEAEPEPVEEIAPVEVAAPALAQVKGAGTRTTWSAEVIDLTALITYVSMNIGARCVLLQPYMKELNRIAVRDKDRFDIPGVKAVPSTSVAPKQ